MEIRSKNVNHPIKDLVGHVFGKLTVKEFEGRNEAGRVYWKCLCNCGKERLVREDALKSGRTKSCGCISGVIIKRGNHGFASGFGRTKIYRVWCGMINRCCNPNNPAYKNYGGRGITVCSRWRNSFMDFYTDIGGEIPKDMTIDRINNDSNYEPGNVRLATRKEQNSNTRRNIVVIIDGVSKNLMEWCVHLNLPYGVVKNRVNHYGWSPERALAEPIKSRKNKFILSYD